MTDAWRPEQYERFRTERSRPFHDLLLLVQWRQRMRVVDLGCGTGELTSLLHVSLGAADTLGIDASPAMLERAAGFVAPGLRFERGDIADFGGLPRLDLVFSNAALHWVPDHPALLAALAGALLPGGQLAFQVPANQDQPTHLTASDVSREEPFASALGDAAGGDWPVLAPERYAQLLHDLGFREQRVDLRVYPHVLPSREDVVEWVKGTTLTRWEAALPADLFARFLARYRERLFDQLPDRRPFFFPFKRILAWGRR